jgi:hypothetical protein
VVLLEAVGGVGAPRPVALLALLPAALALGPPPAAVVTRLATGDAGRHVDLAARVPEVQMSLQTFTTDAGTK